MFVFTGRSQVLDFENEHPYLIGETALNHEGDFEYLRRLVLMAGKLKLNAIKFHVNVDPTAHLTKNHPLAKLSKQVAFDKDQWNKLITLARNNKLQIIGLANNVKTMKLLCSWYPQVSAVEVHATGINDYFLLKSAVNSKGQVILGIGGTEIEEINYAIGLLKGWGKSDLVLMYGFQNYPTDYNKINLARMIKLKQLFGFPMGYADHTAFDDENNEFISSMAITMGVDILEKHLTLDEGKKRFDYQGAVGFRKMAKIKKLTKLAIVVRGDGRLTMSEEELKYGEVGRMRKALVAKRMISKGTILKLSDVTFKRTNEKTYVKQNQLFEFVGLQTNREIKPDEIIDFSKVVLNSY